MYDYTPYFKHMTDAEKVLSLLICFFCISKHQNSKAIPQIVAHLSHCQTAGQ